MDNHIASSHATAGVKHDNIVDKENIKNAANAEIIIDLVDSSEPYVKKKRAHDGSARRWETEKDLSNPMVDEVNSSSAYSRPMNQNFRSHIAGGPNGGQGDRDQRGKNRRLRHGNGQRNDDFYIAQRLHDINGPTLELESLDFQQDTKFSIHNRLYVGNLTSEMSNEEGLRQIFQPYGEIGDIFLNAEKNFAFLKVDFHANAVKAKRALDGTILNGRQLRIRYSYNESTVLVKNLTPYVSNELLHKSFEIFGPIEKAVIKVDDRGNSVGEGIVEFVKKATANACIRLCSDYCFFLTATLRPCIVELMSYVETVDGVPEKSMNRNGQFVSNRSIGPRFAAPDSFEHDYGTRWKQLYAQYESKKAALKRDFQMEEEKLEIQLEFIRNERETEILRRELRMREADRERKKKEWECLQNPGQNVGYDESPMMRKSMQFDYYDGAPEHRSSPEHFGYPNDRPMMRNASATFGYHNEAPIHRRLQGMRRSQEMPDYTQEQSVDENPSTKNNSPFVVFEEDLPQNQNGSTSQDHPGRYIEDNPINRNNEPNQEIINSLWGRRTI
ncbi:hypothetical protein KR222_011486 [Zaprionus bogoriensis]|nr:hypothetical protein KR222_011486 [Zaprionus bogoriensis]